MLCLFTNARTQLVFEAVPVCFYPEPSEHPGFCSYVFPLATYQFCSVFRLLFKKDKNLGIRISKQLEPCFCKRIDALYAFFLFGFFSNPFYPYLVLLPFFFLLVILVDGFDPAVPIITITEVKEAVRYYNYWYITYYYDK